MKVEDEHKVKTQCDIIQNGLSEQYLIQFHLQSSRPVARNSSLLACHFDSVIKMANLKVNTYYVVVI